ncbi:MAG TPA: long-chain fatty acid--CoA ligase [Terriglobales bacterium]|jgi:long-chain acyl-CoA synthetase|nr:long-chain fatty acid--CoA ligase [Terriglobales bacterium]
MSLNTLNDILFGVAARNQAQLMLQLVGEEWRSISSEQFVGKVKGVATALCSWGISKGDRVAILAENRHEWVVADMACLALGAVVVPIHTTLSAEQTAYMLRDSGARAIFVSAETHLEKVQSVRSTTYLEKVAVMDSVATERAVAMSELMQLGSTADLEILARGVQSTDLATIIYTSGTTGTPKGVMLTHGNLASNITAFCRDFGFCPGMHSVSFLPLSHVTARSVEMGLLHRGVILAHLPILERLPKTLLEIAPEILLSVPRIYEKVHTQADIQAATFPKKQIYQWALRVGRAHRDQVLAGKTPAAPTWKLANRLVYSKIRAGIGGRVSIFISGGAPLGRPLAEWYANVGIRIHEGYGLTETSPVISVNTPAAHRIGSVGKPLSNVQVRIAEDGEILAKAPSVFQAYWNNPQETQAAFLDGWFKTGDIGALDKDGYLYVTDRKKDLIKTSGGKFIAPQPIENALKHHSLVAEAVVVGDKRKFPAALIFPNFAALEAMAAAKGIRFASRAELVGLMPVRSRYGEIVEEVNHPLAQFEKLKAFRLVAEELSATGGTLTASLKLRRRAIEEQFKAKIEEMYAPSPE